MTRPTSMDTDRSLKVRPTRKNIMKPASYVFHRFHAHTLNLCLQEIKRLINPSFYFFRCVWTVPLKFIFKLKDSFSILHCDNNLDSVNMCILVLII